MRCLNMDELIEFVRNKIIEWYEKRGRKHLYWRKHTDPYTILIAEILLKRTRAETVAPYITRFLRKYPSLRALAKAPLEEIENILKPLGLYRQRALHIKKLVDVLISRHGGEIPDSYEELIDLPGIGEYTANAVLCFAYKKSVPIVDTNIVRVIIRFFGVKPSKSEARRSPEIWEIARKLTPKNGENARRFWWGMIDFAALVCIPQKPRCSICPLKEKCQYYMKQKKRSS